MMHNLYGDPHRVIAAYRQKIKQWPQIKPGDVVAFRKFHNFLLKCDNVTQIQTWNVLDTPKFMCILLSKLPGGTRDNWSRRVLLIRRKQGKELELADFIDFVNDENLTVNDPVFSTEAAEQYIDKNIKSRNVATYVSGSKEKFVDLALRSPFINCGENHQLDGCLKFMDMALKDRINFLSKKKYCFGCLQPMKPRRNAKTCDKRLNCRTCSGVHPTAMHGYVPKRKKDAQDDYRSNENDESVTNSFADLKTLSTVEKQQTLVISMCIVPVKIKSAAQVKDVLTHAMLDNCRQRSFIQKALVKKMHTSRRKTTLNLKTLNGERSESTSAIDGLQVA